MKNAVKNALLITAMVLMLVCVVQPVSAWAVPQQGVQSLASVENDILHAPMEIGVTSYLPPGGQQYTYSAYQGTWNTTYWTWWWPYNTQYDSYLIHNHPAGRHYYSGNYWWINSAWASDEDFMTAHYAGVHHLIITNEIGEYWEGYMTSNEVLTYTSDNTYPYFHLTNIQYI